MLVSFLITVLVVVVVFVIFRLAVQKMVPDADMQHTIVLVVGLILVIFLIIETVAIVNGGGGRIASGFR